MSDRLALLKLNLKYNFYFEFKKFNIIFNSYLFNYPAVEI